MQSALIQYENQHKTNKTAFPFSAEADELAATNTGERKAVLIILRPKVIPDKVGCLQKVINAKTLHLIAIDIPPIGIIIDYAEKINAIIDNAFIFLFSL